MKTIVAVDMNWGIGCNGKLLQRIPEDMKYFKDMTLGKVVVMGRETFESLPGMEPLKGRINIILSRKDSFKKDNIIICRSMDELFVELKKYNTKDVFSIGGESIYTQLLPYCSEAYVTRIEDTYIADKHFPNLDENKDWEITWESELKKSNDINFRFLKYTNINMSEK